MSAEERALLPVDRDKAAETLLAIRDNTETRVAAGLIASGNFDQHPLVQAFAAHRIAAYERGKRDAAEVEYCSSCTCELCSRRNELRALQSTVDADPHARFWKCSCGWVGGYTSADLEEYGEPSECNRHYHERLVECDRAHALRVLKDTPK